ncbi:MAG: hypothetical protein Kow0092_12090 [Deferrisomatales bacterium]
MTTVEATRYRGVPVVRLVGVLGREHTAPVESALAEAFRCTGGRVLVDLTRTVHLHYGLAILLVTAARCGGRLGLVGASAYVRQILQLAGAVEQGVDEYRDLGEAAREAAA